MRTLLTLLAIVLYLVITLPILLILGLIRLRWPKISDRITRRMIQIFFSLVCLIGGIRITVKGEEHIPRDRPVLFVGNHRSFFDIIVTYRQMTSTTGYVAKHSLKRIPLLAQWMVLLRCLFVNRTSLKDGMQMILNAISQMDQGISVFVFPEGTRSKGANELELLPFHDGSFRIATKKGHSILPVAISGASAILEDHFPWIRPAHVIVEYLPEIKTDGMTRDQKKRIGTSVRDLIGQALQENAGKALPPKDTDAGGK